MNLVAALNAKRHFLSRDLDSTLAELPHNRSVEASSSLLAAAGPCGHSLTVAAAILPELAGI